MKVRLKLIFLVLSLISLSGCRPGVILPPQSVTPAPTDLPRWVIYEKALSRAIVSTDDGLCEWEILGISDKEVYVWALCKVRDPIGTAMSVPAVIHLGENGDIEKITIPRDGYFGEDVRANFPPEVQTKIFARELHGFMDLEHLKARLESGGPPLIVVSGTPLP